MVSFSYLISSSLPFSAGASLKSDRSNLIGSAAPATAPVSRANKRAGYQRIMGSPPGRWDGRRGLYKAGPHVVASEANVRDGGFPPGGRRGAAGGRPGSRAGAGGRAGPRPLRAARGTRARCNTGSGGGRGRGGVRGRRRRNSGSSWADPVGASAARIGHGRVKKPRLS